MIFTIKFFKWFLFRKTCPQCGEESVPGLLYTSTQQGFFKLKKCEFKYEVCNNKYHKQLIDKLNKIFYYPELKFK